MAAAISNAVSEYANISALLDQNARGEFPTKLLKTKYPPYAGLETSHS
jgi:hypothetical protein